ncbi:MAG: haloacid dehalogenase-like hydrolase [Candidatus Hydrogenedentota bacterium]
MVEKSLFPQNIIAIIWDFDRTLSPHYMQKPLFDAYDADEAAFWREVNQLPAYYKKAGVHVQSDTCYLGHLLSYVKHGRFSDLTNARLRELGAQITFFPGVPECLDQLKEIVRGQEFKDAELQLEHYVVSTGLAEMIRGSAIAGKLDGVWASEFIEEPAPPGADFTQEPGRGPISQIAGFLDNTTKTRALFEINKGVNRVASISVNDAFPEEDRRVPFRHMIYVADGPSDIPSFSVVGKHGGMTYAVYDPESESQFAQVVALDEQGRVQAFGPADYRPGSQTMMWLTMKVKGLARQIVEDRRVMLDKRVGRGPSHVDDQPRRDDG